MQTVHITRYRYWTGRRVVWAYNYQIDDGPVCQYGTGLGSLRKLIQRAWPAASVTQGWDQ